jgi:2-polyprenyl-6-methoxyphenol hydroxylase-like FAD-dependent oxidoreductase
MRVAIAGGGRCLVQGLRRAGVEVRVFERPRLRFRRR